MIVYGESLESDKDSERRNEKWVKYTSEDNNKEMYSELIITSGESEGPHEEHPFSNMKKNEADIFKSVSTQSGSNRTVLTKGVAGIGKLFTVQKFILNWAEERANQDKSHFQFCFSTIKSEC